MATPTFLREVFRVCETIAAGRAITLGMEAVDLGSVSVCTIYSARRDDSVRDVTAELLLEEKNSWLGREI